MAYNPTVLARVRHLHLTARVATEALMMGNHRSRRVGQAVEFADYQAYQPGMDLRGLDWKVRGRTDRWVIRRYQTETELAAHLVVDLSADLDTGEAAVDVGGGLAPSKAGYARTLAATLAMWLIRQGEPVALSLVAGEGAPFRELPPRTGRRQLQAILLALASAEPAGRASLDTTLRRVGRRVRRRGLVAVLTDGMEPPEDWLPSLRAFAQRSADLRFLHLYDPTELRLDYPDAAVFVGPEDGARLAVDPWAARAAFAEEVDRYAQTVRQGVVRLGGQYVPVAVDTPMDRVVRSLIRGTSGHLEVR